MDELNADGEGIPPIIASYNKEEFNNVKAIPKTNYKYWKMIDG